MKLKRILVLTLLLMGVFTRCKKEDYPVINPQNTGIVNISTDKARYYPGDQITFTSSKEFMGTVEVKYKHLGTVIDESLLSETRWTWTAPTEDYQGYMAELYSIDGTDEKLIAAVGIDVSSKWTKFPRYGFLSAYGNLTSEQIKTVITNLNKYHINGLQFFDWQYKHHMPLAGTPENPTPVYKDLINRDVYFSTIKSYISVAHDHNITAMFYDLAFGALNDASYDGVSEEWYIFSDRNHANKDLHSLPKPPFRSDIFLLNPGNANWQNYLNNKIADVYEALDFDGFHIDQLGDRGTRYDYWGNMVSLPLGYASFIKAAKTAAPNKFYIMNAVTQFGQKEIAESDVDCLYSEVWDPYKSYADLADVILQNNTYGNYNKNSILAAYMNYNLAYSSGYFNTPGVLFTDAVIFAFGGSHLELGEHMLGQEYFPNNNLQMRTDLQNALVNYYNFMTGYQNLLRDGGTFNKPEISSTDGKTSLQQWPPATGKVAVIGKLFADKQVVHLINFSTAAHFDWRDNSGNQTYPTTYYNCAFSISASNPVKRIWLASPDNNNGASTELSFQTNGNTVNFTLPSLTYWDMIVLEY